MADDPVVETQLVFAHLARMVRTATLYVPMHPQMERAKEALYQALATFLRTHPRLTYRLMDDLLLANDRVLPRESLLYRGLLAEWQRDKGIGSLTFMTGVDPTEIDAVLEALHEGVGSSAAAWMARKNLQHVLVEPPTSPEAGSRGENVARRAYSGAVDVLRDVETSIRGRQRLTVEQVATIRLRAGALLEQILTAPSLVLRLASIKSYDEYTLYHSVNVAVLAMGLGLVLGLPELLLHELAMGGMLHDLGKIAVPAEILRKPGVLDEREWQLMRRHPSAGADLLSRMPGSNRLPMIVAFEHHMRFDGKGYPLVPQGWVQHPVSRLVSVADVFDAMTSRRAYKRAMPTETACRYLREAGTAFDPRLVRVLEHLVDSAGVERTAQVPA